MAGILSYFLPKDKVCPTALRRQAAVRLCCTQQHTAATRAAGSPGLLKAGLAAAARCAAVAGAVLTRVQR